ncbi:MAG: hypothetical protein KME46_17840 [Brasilonema angustatum HA4187-MV1]|jgi:hypothetical protein|nr:hypothetical protein [Brasilonema angustatum HA4187-MV1]
MEERTYSPLQMVDNLYMGNKKLKLINGFNWKPLNSNCLHVLFSIIMLSILGMADSSFAFEAKVKEETLQTYWYPLPGERSDKTLQRSTTVYILYCRLVDHWCYLENYKISQKRIRHLRRWVMRDQLCSNDTMDSNSSPLFSCKSKANYSTLDALLKVRNFYCDEKNPFYWFDYKVENHIVVNYFCPIKR